MNYELCKSLKDAGFPLHRSVGCPDDGCCVCGACGSEPCEPTLPELIEACGAGFKLFSHTEGYVALREAEKIERFYETPEEAMGRFWLKKNKKS